jgi:hypothetical protein
MAETLCQLHIPSRVTVRFTNENVGTGMFSKTWSTFYDFSLKEKLCSQRRFAKTENLAVTTQDPWCLYEGGPNGRIFGYLPTLNFTGPDSGNGLTFVSNPGQVISNAFPCLKYFDEFGQIVIEDSDEGSLFFPKGCARLEPVNACVFGGGNYKYQYLIAYNDFTIIQGVPTYQEIMSGGCLPYSSQRFPIYNNNYTIGVGTYTIEIER